MRPNAGCTLIAVAPWRGGRHRPSRHPADDVAAPWRGDTQRRAAIWAALRAWYATARRALPWRRTRDPYAIVVAEFMLQQTQVERVVPKYQAFLAVFPTWQALATAPRAEVVRAWAGLGYNRRAVWLHRLAQLIVTRYDGALPADVRTLVKLPGLGPYTAAAVVCFALGQHVPLVDTNIRRVLGRMFVGPEALPAHAAWALAAWALPEDNAADWHQALMDLGATICLARRPACSRCPVAAYCVSQPVLDASTALGHVPLRRVAEERAAYGDPFIGSRRYYRGRVVAALRALAPGATLDLATLGPQVKPNYEPADAPWLRGLVDDLVGDGLVEWADEEHQPRVRLAEGEGMSSESTTLAVHPLIRQRVSGRALDTRPVERDKLLAMLEAARWAPSYGNMQPWRFVVVEGAAALEGVRAALTPGNAWAKRAPVLIVGAANPADAKIVDGKTYYLFDLGLAVGNLLLQATALGLVAHPMGGWDEQQIKQALGIPDEVRVVVVIALGYPGRLEDLDERTREKEQQPRTRRPLAEIAFADRWGQPWQT